MDAPRLSARVADLHPSPIREILTMVDRPGMISFAGGLPAAETLPELAARVDPRLLQYGPTEGEPALRARIRDDLVESGLKCEPEQVIVLSGSQQGIDLVAKLFIDRGTPVAVESPTYLAALQVFRFFGAQFLPFSVQRLNRRETFQVQPALLYAIPTFQNPTGYCYPDTQREALARMCERAGVPLFEDDPYRDLAYDPCDRTPVCARLNKSAWIYQGSFSKTLAPGLRLGYLAASGDLAPYLVRLKQAADLHSNRLSQQLVYEQLESSGRATRLRGLVDTYRRKRDAFAVSLAEHFSDLACWDRPKGGLFYWLKLTKPVDTRELLAAAVHRGVAFMPGEPFYPNAGNGIGTLRLNFSHADTASIDRGLRILADLIREQNTRSGSILKVN